jgi:hypothetical protein
MQQAIPGDAQGVPVKLTAIDTNGAVTDLGTAISDMSGMFKKMWTPTVAGEYTIVASFDGTKAYFPSYAETALGVAQPTSGSTPEAGTANNTVQIEIVYALAIILAIVIIVLAFVAIRKK